jgi:hypothetical protein
VSQIVLYICQCSEVEASEVLVPFPSFLQILFIKSVKLCTWWCMMVSPFNAKLSNVWSDGRKSERDCGDEATQFGRREP